MSESARSPRARGFDSRAVVRMATGAALYGVLSWLTNVVPMPSISLVSLRPAIVVPIFFGYTWGPAVGFFSGLVGNAIGDTLTGWGFYPTWVIGNGVLGAVPGLARLPAVARVLGGRGGAPHVLAASALAGLSALSWMMRGVTEPLSERTFLPADFVPSEHADWPLYLALLVAVVWLFVRGRPTAEAVLWGLFGIIGGIGTAALLDVPYNRLTFEATMIGQFLPATLGNAVILVVLFPPLVRSYRRALERAGR